MHVIYGRDSVCQSNPDLWNNPVSVNFIVFVICFDFYVMSWSFKNFLYFDCVCMCIYVGNSELQYTFMI